MPSLDLNRRALELADHMAASAARLRIEALEVAGGGRVLDCGAAVAGGLEAGVLLARLTLADLARVEIEPGEAGGFACPHIAVRTDHPVAACMASQYAGWQIAIGDFFAMGSGPFRALHGEEEIFDRIGFRERSDVAVGVLETRTIPGPEVLRELSEKLGVSRGRITLAVAPTASIACGVQVASRSVETALHKLHALDFDIGRVVSGFGTAPLPPPAKSDLASLGRTNDAVLYGASVSLWVRGDDASLEDAGRRVPSSTSRDWGKPFAEVFARYGNDFYKVDPLLFSPAEVILHNIDTGRTHRFGRRDEDVLRASFYAP